MPAIAREQAFLNQGQFPGHRDETYELPNDDLWLAGTAEVVLTSLHSGEIIDADKLPVLYAGYSPCFRREAGSAGKDVRGLLRVHQFVKVEQYVICEADDAQSAEWHARLLALAESLLSDLEIPYQVIETSTGDMGLGKYRMNDIESWVPIARQISRDAQLLDAARLAGPPGEHSLSRQRRQGAVRAHAQQYGAGLATDPRAAARKSPDGGRSSEVAQGDAGADGAGVPLSYRVRPATTGDDHPPLAAPDRSGVADPSARLLRGFGEVGLRRAARRAAGLCHPRLLVRRDLTTFALRRALADAGWRLSRGISALTGAPIPTRSSTCGNGSR